MIETPSQSDERLPGRSKPVWVQCEGFRCLAVMDEQGKWKTVFGGAELTGNIKVIADLSLNNFPGSPV